MEYKEILERARKNFAGRCRVCPVCNGVACAGEIPGMGGIRQAKTFKRNVAAWDEYGIVMQSMGGAKEPSTKTKFLGVELALPVMVAPIGGVPLNMTNEMAEEEYTDAVCIGALDAGTIAFTGDSGAPGIYDAGLAQLNKTKGLMVPTIKPRENDALVEYANRAISQGAKMLACDMDAAVLVNMRLFNQPVETKTIATWQELVSEIPVPFILKGINTAEEAIAAVRAGVSAIVVSNHGGRILDGMAGTADVLPAIAKAVKGEIPIIVDGGIRGGEDVFKALALGADAVLIGRPAAIAAVGGGREGVTMLLNQYQSAFRDAMMMTGCQTVKEIHSGLLQKI